MQSMQRLLPRMALAKQASNVMHPMLRLLDGEHDELRRDAVSHISHFRKLGTHDICI